MQPLLPRNKLFARSRVACIRLPGMSNGGLAGPSESTTAKPFGNERAGTANWKLAEGL